MHQLDSGAGHLFQRGLALLRRNRFCQVYDLTWTSLVSLTDSEVVEEFLCLGADFGGGGDLLAADLDGDVS